MRISDWSSDVCSSDLAASGADKPSAAHDRSGEHRTTAGSACACELRRARCRDFRSERNQSMTRLLFVSASALALAACAGKTPPPAIHSDAPDFSSSVAEAEPAKPIEISETPFPFPLHGQLHPPRCRDFRSERNQAMARLLFVSASALALAACAGKTPPPAIHYDAADFRAAVEEAEPAKPIEIVETPVPLPLPGQLQPPPSVKPEAGPPTARVDAANRAATKEPSSSGYINAVQVYPWTEGALYRLYAAPERVSDIALQPGEQLVAVSAGDTVRWIIGDTSSGAGEGARVHVLVKPFAPGLATNMVITPDRRSDERTLGTEWVSTCRA